MLIVYLVLASLNFNSTFAITLQLLLISHRKSYNNFAHQYFSFMFLAWLLLEYYINYHIKHERVFYLFILYCTLHSVLVLRRKLNLTSSTADSLFPLIPLHCLFHHTVATSVQFFSPKSLYCGHNRTFLQLLQCIHTHRILQMNSYLYFNQELPANLSLTN